MAVSGILAVTPAVATNLQQMRCTLTLTLPVAGTAIGVVRITPYISGATGQGAAGYTGGTMHIPIGTTTLLTASATVPGNLSFSWQAYAPAPASPTNPAYPSTPAYDSYTLGAIVDFTDGTNLNVTSGTIYVYPLVSGSSLSLTQMPVSGQAFFAQPTESGTIGAMGAPFMGGCAAASRGI